MTPNLSKCWKLNAGDKMLEMLAAAIHAIAKKMHDAGDEMSHRLCNLHSPSGGVTSSIQVMEAATHRTYLPLSVSFDTRFSSAKHKQLSAWFQH